MSTVQNTAAPVNNNPPCTVCGGPACAWDAHHPSRQPHADLYFLADVQFVRHQLLMADEHLSPFDLRQYEAELRERYGDEVVDEAKGVEP